MMNSKYRTINKSDNKIMTTSDPAFVAQYLIGRRLDNYMVIKSDSRGDRLISLKANNYQDMIVEVEAQ